MWRLGREYVEAVLCRLDVELVGWTARNFPMSLTGPNTTTCTSIRSSGHSVESTRPILSRSHSDLFHPAMFRPCRAQVLREFLPDGFLILNTVGDHTMDHITEYCHDS